MSQDSDSKPGPFAALLKTLTGVSTKSDLKESVREALAEPNGGEEHSLSEVERELLSNIIEYSEVRVEDILVPRTDIVAVDVDTSLKDLLRTLADASHSRLPVFRETLDEVLGMVHVKDVLSFLASEDPQDGFKLNNVKRPVIYAPPSMKIIDLLAKMRRQRIHMAIVVDEYGGTDGLVTIEDVVEQIVGEIEDEHDVDTDPQLQRMSDGCLMADARLPIENLEDELGQTLLPEEDENEADTLGGLVFMLAGEVPDIGTLVEHDSGIVFEVIDADPRRIKQIRVHPAGTKRVRPAEKAAQ